MVYGLTINEQNFAPAKISSISTFVNIFLPLLTAGAALACLIMAFYGAYLYLTNGDKPDVLKKAQGIIIYAFIGLIIVISSFVAVQLLGKIFGIDKII
ncbi:MAG: hypothetical protein N2593_02700 [Patescibacteria group bacterium]|nr:hypothetical protein [Patescibacteria group bacterium]